MVKEAKDLGITLLKQDTARDKLSTAAGVSASSVTLDLVIRILQDPSHVVQSKCVHIREDKDKGDKVTSNGRFTKLKCNGKYFVIAYWKLEETEACAVDITVCCLGDLQLV